MHSTTMEDPQTDPRGGPDGTFVARSVSRATTTGRSRYSRLTTTILTCYRAGRFGVTTTRSLAKNLLTSTFIHIPKTSGIFLNSTIACSVHTGTSVLNMSTRLLHDRKTIRPRITHRVTTKATELCQRRKSNSYIVKLSAAKITKPKPSKGGPTNLTCINYSLPRKFKNIHSQQARTFRLHLRKSERDIQHNIIRYVLRGLERLSTSSRRWSAGVDISRDKRACTQGEN